MSYNIKKQYPKSFAEFFAGIGLMRMGLEKAGWEISFANDIDPVKKSIYNNQFNDFDDQAKTKVGF
jgi:DNA (cytosine-5)-methyltransferase 1